MFACLRQISICLITPAVCLILLLCFAIHSPWSRRLELELLDAGRFLLNNLVEKYLFIKWGRQEKWSELKMRQYAVHAISEKKKVIEEICNIVCVFFIHDTAQTLKLSFNLVVVLWLCMWLSNIAEYYKHPSLLAILAESLDYWSLPLSLSKM